MANITENPTFEPVIHEIGTGEPVLGGPGGNSNVQAQQLANRTQWLKAAIDSLESGGGPFDFNASSGNLPTGGSDGAGVAGIRRKDQYFVTVPGTVSSVTLQVGDVLIAKVDDADTIGEFIIQQGNSELATPTIIGMVKLVQNLSGGSQADAVLSVAGLINLFAQLNNPTFTGIVTVPDKAAGTNNSHAANTKYVYAAVGVETAARATAVTNEANARIAGDNAEASARVAADNGLQANINNEATTRANADTTLQANINNEASARVSADSTLQTNINNEASARLSGDNAVAAMIPQFVSLSSPMALPRVDGSNDRQVANSSLPGMKIGFWCRFTLNAAVSGNVGVLSARSPSICGGNNILRQVDTGYGTNANNSEHSWFVPCPPGVTITFSIGHYIGSGAYADIVITCYV
jgi:hypothetical protein